MERKRSWVWNHFTETDDSTKVVCGICKAELMYSNRTGTMINHLKSKHPGATAGNAVKVTSNQRSMDAFTARRNCPPSKSELITKSVADMIAIDLLPISMVEGAGFRDMMKIVQPEYTVPGRTQMTQRIEKRYVCNW